MFKRCVVKASACYGKKAYLSIFLCTPHLRKSYTSSEAGEEFVCINEKFRTMNTFMHAETCIIFALLTLHTKVCSAHVS